MSGIVTYNCGGDLIQSLKDDALIYKLDFTIEEVRQIVTHILGSREKNSYCALEYHNIQLDNYLNLICPNPGREKQERIFSYIEVVAAKVDQYCKEVIS